MAGGRRVPRSITRFMNKMRFLARFRLGIDDPRAETRHHFIVSQCNGGQRPHHSRPETININKKTVIMLSSIKFHVKLRIYSVLIFTIHQQDRINRPYSTEEGMSYWWLQR